MCDNACMKLIMVRCVLEMTIRQNQYLFTNVDVIIYDCLR